MNNSVSRFKKIMVFGFLLLALIAVQSYFVLQHKDEKISQIGVKTITVHSNFSGYDNAIAQNINPSVTPNALYSKAFHLLKEMFYDHTYNGQDFDRWEDHYNGKLKTLSDSHKAIETMIASLGDQYTRFLDVEAFDDEKSQIDAHLFGVGMQLGMNKDGKIIIITPIADTPAFKAGVQPGDEVIEVNDKPVKGQSLDLVVKQIKGPINTKVKITFLRKSEHRKVELTRAEIPVRAVVDSEIIDPVNKIGYIRLETFISSRAKDEMKDALDKIGNSNGIILDLRNNPGGLLTNAIDIASMFMNKGIVVSTIDADGYKTSTPVLGNSVTGKPMVILINGNSASASEILSGALHDNGRAKLVGQKSYGKGLVQQINRLEDGSGINITIARYLTPNDTDIHKVGIKPDFVVKLKEADYLKGRGPWWIDPTMTHYRKTAKGANDIQLNKALEVIKSEINTEKKSPEPSVTAQK